MNGHNYKGARFKKLKDMSEGGEEQKLYEAAGNVRRNTVRKCPTSVAYEGEKQPLQELLKLSIKSSKANIKKRIWWS